VAPTEWEAVEALGQVTKDTKWSDWKGLPGNAKLYQHLRHEADWKSAPVSKSRKSSGDVPAGMASAAKKLSVTYELPYMKHAPIGPAVAVGDYRPDGTVTVHTHTQNAQALRGQLAMMLGLTADKVVVKTYAGAGHYGPSNGGNAIGPGAATGTVGAAAARAGVGAVALAWAGAVEMGGVAGAEAARRAST